MSSRTRRSKAEAQKLRREVVAMAEDGAPAHVIASELELSLPYVYMILQEAQVDPAPPLHRSTIHSMTEEDAAKIAKAYQDGRTMTSILAEYGISHHQMYSLLAKFGVPLRELMEQRRQVRSQMLEAAVEMYLQGATYAAIREETGMSPQLVLNALRLRNIGNRTSIRNLDVVIDPNPDPEPMSSGRLLYTKGRVGDDALVAEEDWDDEEE